MIEAILERFPKFALHALGWEPKPLPVCDLSSWSNVAFDKIEVLYVFGIGDGSAYAYLQEWLHQDPERQLVFIEEDTGILASIFRSENPLVADLQVEIEWLAPGPAASSLLSELAERYPAKRIEALALVDSPRFRRYRLALLRKTTLSHALFIDRLHGYQHFENFLRNIPHVQKSFYANGLKNAFQGVPAIVCGAGPSLQKAIPILRKLENKAILIAGGSTIAALSSAGIEPHFGLAIDPNLEEYRRFRNSFAFECPLIFSTRVFPPIFNTCNGPFGYMRAGIGGAPELWLEEEMGLTDPLLGEHLTEESLSVTAICLAFAQHLGCDTILLSGVDLAYTGGQRYAPGVSDEKTNLAELESEKSAADRILRRKDPQGKTLYTAVRWVMEGASISRFAKKHPEIRWVNTTEEGLPIEGLERMSLEGAAEKLLIEEWPLREKVMREIFTHPMPTLQKDLVAELRESLERLIEHLEILAEKKRGSKALAEMEMREELAMSILFYDMHKVCEQALCRKERKKDDGRNRMQWQLFLDIAKKYLLRFSC